MSVWYCSSVKEVLGLRTSTPLTDTLVSLGFAPGCRWRSWEGFRCRGRVERRLLWRGPWPCPRPREACGGLGLPLPQKELMLQLPPTLVVPVETVSFEINSESLLQAKVKSFFITSSNRMTVFALCIICGALWSIPSRSLSTFSMVDK